MLKTVLMVIHVLVSLFLIAVILLQKGKSAGISGVIEGGAETFFGKNKART
ncbi:MAG: preprotein translocase subunit SecG, partial [Thermoanaerobacter sp.]|nr:preprotein translocase subunit SecG [Thermoanaerobacter sp.]